MNRFPAARTGHWLGWLALACLSQAQAQAQAQAQGSRSFTGSFAVDPALAIVYGGPLWEGSELAAYPQFDEGRAYVEAIFDAPYVEDGVAKHIVIATLTPRPRSQFACHACSPLLGGAVFRAEADTWTLDAVGRTLEFGHAYFGMASSLDLVRIGPERYGVLHRIEDASGGYESKRTSLIFAPQRELLVGFAAPPVEGPGTGACGIPETQHLRVTVDEPVNGGGGADDDAANPAYFDLIVDARWNDAQCRTLEPLVVTFSGQACQRLSRYRFANGAYALLAVEREECTPLPEGVRVSQKG